LSHALRVWRERLGQERNEMNWRSLLHPSAWAQLSRAANCGRCNYTTWYADADGQSKCCRFSAEQKWAIVQEAENSASPPARFSAGGSNFGLTTRSAPWLKTVSVADDASDGCRAR